MQLMRITLKPSKQERKLGWMGLVEGYDAVGFAMSKPRGGSQKVSTTSTLHLKLLRKSREYLLCF